jgi:CCR4-NOT complex subunit CAF16
MSQTNGKEIAPSIDVKSLSYAFPDGSSGLTEVFLNLPPGSRTLLIGGDLPQFLPLPLRQNMC